MIRKLNYRYIDACYGGNGECQCRGTGKQEEKIFGTFKKMTANENECATWCFETIKGKQWAFDSSYIYKFGFGKHWHSASDSHIL